MCDRAFHLQKTGWAISGRNPTGMITPRLSPMSAIVYQASIVGILSDGSPLTTGGDDEERHLVELRLPYPTNFACVKITKAQCRSVFKVLSV
jgi:hypothetical protein